MTDGDTVEVDIHWELTKAGIWMAFLSGVGATVFFYEYILPILF